MNVEIADCLYGKKIAVALSGGADSMALINYLVTNSQKYSIKVVALNVEHGIRGDASLRDSAFVKNYCESHKPYIPLLEYKVNALKKAKDEKITVEQAARILRYECFFDAIKTGNCDAVVTAHHSSDNLESVLFNLFRGTGLKGLTGIKDFDGKIFRPFIKVSKAEIEEYVAQNSIPFVTDESNFSDDYSRNYLRLNVIPLIKKIFPEAEKSVLRLSDTVAEEDRFLDGEAKKALTLRDDGFFIKLPLDRVLLSRAVIFALKELGIKKDYEKVHVLSVCELAEKQAGKTIYLPLNVKAVKEYDGIALYNSERRKNANITETPFTLGKTVLNGAVINIIQVKNPDLKSGLFADADKIPVTATVRNRRSGDRFTKFGGGSKSLSDFLTDKKIPLKDRDGLILIADGQEILAIFGVAVSDKIKVDEKTNKIIRFNLQRTDHGQV